MMDCRTFCHNAMVPLPLAKARRSSARKTICARHIRPALKAVDRERADLAPRPYWRHTIGARAGPWRDEGDTPMPSGMVWPLIFVLLGVLTALFDPLGPVGNRIGPGWGDVLNGAVGFVFLLLAGASAIIAKRRARRSLPQ
jgi:hypothetical protein